MALFLFNRVITPAAFTLPDNQQFALELGVTTLVQFSSDRSLTFVGLAATGGNLDGMVVCFSNLNNSSFTLTLAHESSSASTAGNRFRNTALASVTGGTGAGGVWYRYNATVARWINLART